MDKAQLQREYQRDTSFHVNPPSFETWLAARQQRERARADAYGNHWQGCVDGAPHWGGEDDEP